MNPNTSSIHRKFVVVGLIVICSLLLTTGSTYAQDPDPPGEGGGSGLTAGEVQGSTVEGPPSGGTDTQDPPPYNGCFFVWYVWTEDNLGINGTFEPGDWIYLYMQFDNECFLETIYGTLYWQLEDPDGSPGLDTSYYNPSGYWVGTYKYYWEGQIEETDKKGEWTFYGSTSYYGGVNTETTTFKIVPKYPSGVSASDDTYTDKVRVTWSASTGATYYKVFRATSSGGMYSQIGTPSGTTFDDTTATAGTTYWYKVKGCVSVGCSSYSNYDSGRRATGSGTDEDTVGLYDPATSRWFLKADNAAGGSITKFYYGPAGGGRLPITGDWNGDGTDTVGLYDPATSRWFLKADNAAGGSITKFYYGPAGGGRLPIVGDWNGDGTDTVGLYDPATSRWFLKADNAVGGSITKFYYGPAGGGRLPITGDWNGDGTDTIGMYDPATSRWFLKADNAAGGSITKFYYGPAGGGRLPITGDWDGDVTDTIGMYDPAISRWFLKAVNGVGGSITKFYYGPAGGGRLPITGDW